MLLHVNDAFHSSENVQKKYNIHENFIVVNLLIIIMLMNFMNLVGIVCIDDMFKHIHIQWTFQIDFYTSIDFFVI